MQRVFNMKYTRSFNILVILAALGILGGCKHIYTEIDIKTPPERVWRILSDIEHYPDWNPYHVKVTGTLAVGEQLDVTIHKPNGETVHIKPHVIRLEPNVELTWGGGIKGLFHGKHVFRLESAGNGITRLVQQEDFVGIFVPFASLDAIDEGYRLMNERLKERAEKSN